MSGKKNIFHMRVGTTYNVVAHTTVMPYVMCYAIRVSHSLLIQFPVLASTLKVFEMKQLGSSSLTLEVRASHYYTIIVCNYKTNNSVCNYV